MSKIRVGSALVVLALMGAMVLGVVAMAQEAGAQPTPEQLEAMQQRAAELGLPEGTIQLTPCVPTMGEHWANPAEMPLGPIYGVADGKLTFVEIMPSQEAFQSGESWIDVLQPIEGYAIDHVDFVFEEGGHEGYEVNHYDIHAYFVPHVDEAQICPAG